MPQKRKEQEKPTVRDGLDDQVDDLREPREHVGHRTGEKEPAGGKGAPDTCGRFARRESLAHRKAIHQNFANQEGHMIQPTAIGGLLPNKSLDSKKEEKRKDIRLKLKRKLQKDLFEKMKGTIAK